MALKTSNSRRLNFVHSFKPIYILSRIFGFMPFTIAYNSDGGIQRARITVIDFIWFTISIGVYIFSTLNFIAFIMRTQVPHSYITLAYATRSIIIMRKLFYIVCIAADMCNRFKLVEILKKIGHFDEKVG